MISEQLIADIKHSHERLRIALLMPGRPDITDWAETCIGLATGKVDVADIRPFTAAEKDIIAAIENLLADVSYLTTRPGYEPMPPGALFPFLSLSPLVLVSQMLDGDVDGSRFNKQPFANKEDLEVYFDDTIIAPFGHIDRQRLNFSWTMNEALDFIWHQRNHNPELFFQLIGREYKLAEIANPWLLEIPIKSAASVASTFFPTIKCGPSNVMRSIGNAQRLQCIGSELHRFTGLSVADLKPFAEGGVTVNPKGNLFHPGLQDYLNTMDTSVFNLRKRLMLDCCNLSEGENQDFRESLSDFRISGLAEGEPFHDRVFSGTPTVKAKGMVAEVIGEAGKNYPTCRKAGNGGIGNDDVERESGSGGSRNLPLGTHYGHTLQQLAYQWVLQTVEVSKLPLQPASAGLLAQRLADDITEADSETKPQNAQAIMELEAAYHSLGNRSFGSPLALASFDIAKWDDPAEHAKRWAMLADGVNDSSQTDDQAYYITTRQYLQSFWFDGLQSPLFTTSALVWTHMAHAMTLQSGQLIWQLLRNIELKRLGISFKKMRRDSEDDPSQLEEIVSKAAKKRAGRKRENRLQSFEDILPGEPRK